MRSRRTPEEEQARQLKIISYQLTPMTAFVRVGLYLSVFLLGLGLLVTLVFGFQQFR